MDGIKRPGENKKFRCKLAYVSENTMYETEGKRLRDNIVGKLAFEKHYKNKIQKFFSRTL